MGDKTTVCMGRAVGGIWLLFPRGSGQERSGASGGRPGGGQAEMRMTQGGKASPSAAHGNSGSRASVNNGLGWLPSGSPIQKRFL